MLSRIHIILGPRARVMCLPRRVLLALGSQSNAPRERLRVVGAQGL
jgi:hypothetical protein